ncbi:MAG: DNA primase [Thermodesulfobacteriota bacterium]
MRNIMIPKDKIEEIRERTGIVALINEYVPLKKRGANWLGLCPFHSEKTPSFSVNEEKKIFHCFGCHETGSAITFLMKKDGLPFPDAVKELARRCGVTIQEEKGAGTGLKDSLYKVNRAAKDYYTRMLFSSEGAGAREYVKKRGFTDKELVVKFGLGYASTGWSGLVRHLEQAGYSEGLLVKAGLISKGDKGSYDRFRERLIFPITDRRERVIGFGGRALGERGPKYLNSPETVLFKKGETLFGLFQAGPSIKELGFAIVVEGYFDMLAMYAAGFTNTVATLGTALTKGHIRILRGYAESLYTLFDADEAGVKATIKSMELFVGEDMRCRVVTIKGAKDPDEFLRANGAEQMQKAIAGATPLMEFYLKGLEADHGVRSPEAKAAFLDSALHYILQIKNMAERDHYASYVASVLQMPPASVYEALRSGLAPSREGVVKDTGPLRRKSIASLRGSTLVEFILLKAVLTKNTLYCPDVREAVEVFGDNSLKKAGAIICDALDSSASLRIDELADAFCAAEIDGIMKTGLLGDENEFMEDPERMFKDSLKKILNRGKLKTATKEMLGRLRDSGQAELVEKIRKRIEKKDI